MARRRSGTAGTENSGPRVGGRKYLDDDTPSEVGAVNNPEAEPRRSTRVRKPVIRDDYVIYLTCEGNPSDPETVEKAMKSPKRKEKSHEENKTWELVNPPDNRKLLTTEWVFKTKRNVEEKN